MKIAKTGGTEFAGRLLLQFHREAADTAHILYSAWQNMHFYDAFRYLAGTKP
jgi:hypothetical protein